MGNRKRLSIQLDVRLKTGNWYYFALTQSVYHSIVNYTIILHLAKYSVLLLTDIIRIGKIL
jgi:hypothetical protein